MARKKGIFSKDELRNFLQKENSCVVKKNSVIDVYLLPYYLNDVVSGLWNALHKKLKAYDTKLEGILLGYENIKVDLEAGQFSGKYAEIKYPVNCDCYIFQPSVGDMLEGKVNKMSSDHIGCIVHQYFNATIMKPIDENYDDWNNRYIEYDEVITFRVKDLDYTGYIPYIEGELETFPTKINKVSDDLLSIETDNNYDVYPKKQKKKFRNDASLISSTQIVRKSNSFSDSGLEFDILSPIPQLKTAEIITKKQKSSKIVDDEIIQYLFQNEGIVSSNNSLKRKNEVFPENSNSKKRKINSDIETDSSTRGSEKVVKKKKIKSLFGMLAQKTPKKNEVTKELNNDPPSLHIFESIEAVIKQNQSDLEEPISPNTKKSSKSSNKKLTEQFPNVSPDKNSIKSHSIINNKNTTTSIKKKSLNTIGNDDDNLSSKICITPINAESSSNTEKVKKSKKIDSAIKQKSIISYLTAEKSQELKTKSDVTIKDDKKVSHLSPYSDAIESVIKQTNSVSYMDTIDSVVKLSIYSSEEENISSNKMKKAPNVSPDKNSTQPYPIVNKKTTTSIKKKSLNNIGSDDNHLSSNITPISGKSSLTTEKYNEKVKKSKKIDSTIKQKSVISYLTSEKSDVTIKDEKEAFNLSPYSDAIEAVIKQNHSDSEKPSSSKTKKNSKSSNNKLTEQFLNESSYKNNSKSGSALDKETITLKKKKSLNSVDNDEFKNKKTKSGEINRIEKKIFHLSPYSDAIESVIKQTNSASYMDTIDSVVKLSICSSEEENISSNKKMKKIDGQKHKTNVMLN